MTKTPDDDVSISQVLGAGYAHVQHGLDKVIEWGFEKMNAAADAPETKKAREPENEVAAKAKRFAKGTAKFLSSTVNAYYSTYRDLKKNEGK